MNEPNKGLPERPHGGLQFGQNARDTIHEEGPHAVAKGLRPSNHLCPKALNSFLVRFMVSTTVVFLNPSRPSRAKAP